MELRHLRYFVTVAEELNISRASARLRISQPAVSRQLREFALHRRQHGWHVEFLRTLGEQRDVVDERRAVDVRHAEGHLRLVTDDGSAR